MPIATVGGDAVMIWVSDKRRLPLTIALLAGLLVIGVIISHAHGPKPQAGATYTGTVYVETPAGRIIQRLPLSFAVSSSSAQVSAFRFPDGLPRACQPTKLGPVTPSTASTPVKAPGGFEVNLAITAASGRVGTLEVSGVFHSFNRETGAVATHYSSSQLRSCSASGGYTAKASS